MTVAVWWRILRDPAIRAGWSEVVTDHGVGSCQPQRAEFRRSARNEAEYDQMSTMFTELYPDAPLPKNTWQWVESAQHRLVRATAHRALSCVDLLICAVAAQRGLVILHDDNDFATAARHLTELRERQVQQLHEPANQPSLEGQDSATVDRRAGNLVRIFTTMITEFVPMSSEPSPVILGRLYTAIADGSTVLAVEEPRARFRPMLQPGWSSSRTAKPSTR